MFGLFKSPKRRMLDRSEKMFPIMLKWIRGLPDAGVGLLLDGALTMKDAGMRDDSTGFGAVFYRNPSSLREEVLLRGIEYMEGMFVALKANGEQGAAMAGMASIWYMSWTATAFPSLRSSGVELWRELKRGFPHCKTFDPEQDCVLGFE
jgi:hypothetical protein